VPGLSPVHVSEVAAAPAPTSVPIDCTRWPCVGGEAPDALVVHGVPGGVVPSAINHVTHPCALAWLGLSALLGAAPRPPPSATARCQTEATMESAQYGLSKLAVVLLLDLVFVGDVAFFIGMARSAAGGG